MKVKVCIVGGGIAGLAAAARLQQDGVSCRLIERGAYAGGGMRQAIQDDFGEIRYGERMSGPEYAERLAALVRAGATEVRTRETVVGVAKIGADFLVTSVSPAGVTTTECESILLAVGGTARPPKRRFLSGGAPAGVFSGAEAQYYINILGKRIGRRVVILGSDNLALSLARQLVLEGDKVVAVFEPGKELAASVRTVLHCVKDLDIPAAASYTVTRLFGTDSLEGVEVSAVGDKGEPTGEREVVDCDTLVVSAGFTPDTALPSALGLTLEGGAPYADASYMTSVPGVFVCGNALRAHSVPETAAKEAEEAADGMLGYLATKAGRVKA
ncbi:MAG: FAD-dependent oxidoreductase [Clostridiales bacterium]|jgi:thioredoxin reductase|nr:FAD-dependent oxidoreductase [Clostridiales bacterium]